MAFLDKKGQLLPIPSVRARKCLIVWQLGTIDNCSTSTFDKAEEFE